MSLTLKQAGLLTQSFGVQNAGTPGDLGTVDFGSFTRRSPGPSLAGWTQGWAAHNSNADARQLYTIANGSGEDLKGLWGAWYYFGPGTVSGGGKIYLLNFFSQSQAEYQGLQMHVGTMALDLISVNNKFVAAPNIKTVRRNWWVWLGLAYERTGADGSTTWTMKVLYREAGSGTTQVLYTTELYNMAALRMEQAWGGTFSGGGSVIYARYGLPRLYQMGSMADAAYPTEVAEPPTSPIFYCRSDAIGGGTGIANTANDAFTPAELIAEAANGKFTLLSGDWLDSNNSVVDYTAQNKTTIRAGFQAGTYHYGGPKIYLNDSAGPIRFTTPFSPKATSFGQLLPDPALGRKVDVRGSTRISSWTLHAGNVWKATFTNTYGVVFEYDSLSEANSITGKPRWLTHPTAANLAAYLAAATAGSFWTDGTTVYLWPTGSGDPNSNGKVYEVTGGDNTIAIQCTGFLLQDLAIQNCASVDFFTNTSPTLSTGDCVKFEGDGPCIANRCDMSRGGRHIWATADSFTTNAHQRSILIDCTLNDMRPSVYGSGGGQTLLVWNGNTTNGIDHQWSIYNCRCTTTNGVVGSTTGQITSDAALDEHNGGGASYVFTEGEILNSNFPGVVAVGHATTTLNVDNNVLGMAGQDMALGTKNLTLTRNRILSRGMPSIGAGVNPGAGTHTIRANTFVLSGAINATPTIIGTASVEGNTIDATAQTGGTTKALWTRGGVVALTFRGNNLKLNNGDLYRVFDTITPASGDSLAMAYNQIEGTDSARILITSYAGATKTLAQIVAGGQDTGSAFSANIKLGFNLECRFDSTCKGFVPLATVTTLASTRDNRGIARPASGSTDAGAFVYYPKTKNVTTPQFRGLNS